MMKRSNSKMSFDDYYKQASGAEGHQNQYMSDNNSASNVSGVAKVSKRSLVS